MRRAIIATVGTVAALVAVLDYKSHGTVTAVQVAVPSGTSTASTPSTTVPSTSSGSSSSGSTSSGSSSATTTPATTPTTSTGGSYTGTEVRYQYGEIEVAIAVKDGKITDVTVPLNSADDPQSASINSQAVPILTKEALAAQSIHFDVVSGATYTSEAFAQALQSALSKAGK
jgi:uncharacterized protein with FMN-binding domain